MKITPLDDALKFKLIHAEPLAPNQLEIVQQVRAILNTMAFSNNVTVYQTIHGHIIELEFTGVGSMRFVNNELSELSGAGCRWFEFESRAMIIGLPYAQNEA